MHVQHRTELHDGERKQEEKRTDDRHLDETSALESRARPNIRIPSDQRLVGLPLGKSTVRANNLSWTRLQGKCQTWTSPQEASDQGQGRCGPQSGIGLATVLSRHGWQTRRVRFRDDETLSRVGVGNRWSGACGVRAARSPDISGLGGCRCRSWRSRHGSVPDGRVATRAVARLPSAVDGPAECGRTRIDQGQFTAARRCDFPDNRARIWVSIPS